MYVKGGQKMGCGVSAIWDASLARHAAPPALLEKTHRTICESYVQEGDITRINDSDAQLQ
jgi:hypothetical protein